MTNQDKKDIAEIIASASKSSENISLKTNSVTEWLFRGLLALLLFMGNNIRKNQNELLVQQNNTNKTISTMEMENKYYKEDISEFKTILAKPRFTREDFDLGISPIITQLNKNTAELNTRSGFMETVSNRIIKLEIEQENLTKYINK